MKRLFDSGLGSGALLLTIAGVAVGQATNPTANGTTNGATVERQEVVTQEVIVEERTIAYADNQFGGPYWDITGPIRLRAADTQAPGTVELRQSFEWSTGSDGTDDDALIALDVEWGFAPDHELSVTLPTELGDGGVDGNFDVVLGWQWRILKEDACGWMPAIGIRNQLRVPNGHQSEGVDWTLTGLVTKTLIPCKLRFHANPFLQVVGRDEVQRLAWDAPRKRGLLSEIHDDELRQNNRHFNWGFVTGFDYLINENLNVVVDYIHETSALRGYRNQHSMEAGLNWQLGEDNRHVIGLVNRWTLDGDNMDQNFTAGLSYSYIFKSCPTVCR